MQLNYCFNLKHMAIDGFIIHKKDYRVWSQTDPGLNPSYPALGLELWTGHLSFQKFSFHIVKWVELYLLYSLIVRTIMLVKYYTYCRAHSTCSINGCCFPYIIHKLYGLQNFNFSFYIWKQEKLVPIILAIKRWAQVTGKWYF